MLPSIKDGFNISLTFFNQRRDGMKYGAAAEEGALDGYA
ncbi:hypothetical protein AERO8C_140248 [Aeromonas veronii]|uniref:Uncharacterized protein n=1 Tax=Aeromonas veronii TaxID=654 RepID=A0A653KU02_AERVE|nr:hypothetical protein AERO8C_140248 [Aeromonas veronii]